MVPDPFNGNRKFIAAQGPLRSTVKDFWLMILENNVEFIVVVANLEESGREKCYKYWPDLNCTLELSADLKVLNLSEEIVNRGDLAIRKFRLKNRTVTMLHFIGWPDHDVPSSEQIPALLKINDIISLTTSPVVVHCSAGVGRTGTFITINCCLNLLKNNDVGERDVVYECLAQIRKYRMRLVETFAQYMFCYQVVLSQLKSSNK
jgi:protein tyrosine phosphatase